MYISYKIKDLYYLIRDFFNPRQRWLTKKIPNHWCDKVELIPLCLFTVLKHFVEEEMDNVIWDWSEEVKSGFMSQEYADREAAREKDIRSLYHYITVERLALEQQRDNSYPPYDDLTKPLKKGDYEKLYGEVNQLEKLLEEKDTDALIRIVNLRGYLWT